MQAGRAIAVVTGASRGIGRSIALNFANHGYEVWALARSEAALGSLNSELKSNAGGIRSLSVDLARPEQVLAACQRILQESGAPKVLVNNAGIAPSAPLARMGDSDFDQVMQINLKAPFIFCRELMPAMAAAGGGRVINLGSTASFQGYKYTSAYCASKHALLGLTHALAVEFAASQVTVNAMCPGWVDTDMTKDSAARISKATGRTSEESRQLLAEMNPMGRLIRPEEVADLCLFLASPAAAAITGSAYVIDGGELA